MNVFERWSILIKHHSSSMPTMESSTVPIAELNLDELDE